MNTDLWSRHAGAIVVVLLVLVAGALPSESVLPSSRPRSARTTATEARNPVLIERRIAADPWRGVPERLARRDARPPGLLGELIEEAKRGNDQVLVVVAATQPYAEQTERRVRDRLALHHAAAAAELVPQDAEHLRLTAGRTLDGREFAVPLEVFVPRPVAHEFPGLCADRSAVDAPAPSRGVVVLWVGNDIEGDVRLWEKLEAIASHVRPVLLSDPDSATERLEQAYRTAEAEALRTAIPQDRAPARLTRRPGSTPLSATCSLTILGPPYSGDLVWLLREAARSDRGPLASMFRADEMCAPTIRVISHAATATTEALRAEVLARVTSESIAERARQQERLDGALRAISRPTCTDEHLLRALVNELKLRQRPGASKPPTILLLVEQDTAYGRSLGALFRDLALAEGLCADCVVVMPYLRGIDGESVDVAHVSGAAPATSGSGSAVDGGAMGLDLGRLSSREAADPALGEVRSDYLRRLTRWLSEQRDLHLGAIGLLGSDHYDKLLLAQALRPEFPDAIYFTTEADARMLAPAARPWLRNMVVATPFGLIHPDGGDALRACGTRSCDPPPLPPPFRDSAQVSMYRSAKAYFQGRGAAQGTPRSSQAASSESTPGASLFEVGRSRFVELSDTDDAARKYGADPRLWITMIAIFAFVVLMAYGHISSTVSAAERAPPSRRIAPVSDPPPASRGPDERTAPTQPPAAPSARRLWPPSTGAYLLWCSAGVVTLLLAVIRSQGGWFPVGIALGMCLVLSGALACIWVGEERSRSEGSPSELEQRTEGRRRFNQWVVVAILAALALTLPPSILWLAGSPEPFEPLEGVSIWPTESARLLVALVACLSLIAFWRSLRRDHDDLARRFELTGPPAPWAPAAWSLVTWRANDEPNSITALWQEFRRRTTRWATARRVFMVGVVWILGLGALFVAWPATTPARGAAAFQLDLLCTILFVPCTLALNLVIWDQIRACNRFLQLMPVGMSDYPKGPLLATGHHRELAPSLLDLRLIVALTSTPRRMVYVPLMLLVVAMLVRSRLVDNWQFTPSLAIALSLSVGVALHGALMLRATARETREFEVARLQDLEVHTDDNLERDRPSRKECDEVIGLVRAFDEGVFSGVWNDPVVRALFIPLLPLLIKFGADLASRYMS